jgi:hypothetical protein
VTLSSGITCVTVPAHQGTQSSNNLSFKVNRTTEKQSHRHTPLGYQHSLISFLSILTVSVYLVFPFEAPMLSSSESKYSNMHSSAFKPSVDRFHLWRIENRFICPGSTRYSNRHRHQNRKMRSKPVKLPLPSPVSHDAIIKEATNRPSLSASKLSRSLITGYSRINSQILILLTMVLCTLRMMNRRMHRFQFQQDESNSVKSPPSLQSDLFASDWSTEESLANYPGLRYLSPWLNVVKKGISPMYMNDPSQTHSSQSPGGETPEDWLIEFRRMKREQKRKSRASKNITKKQVYYAICY